MEKEEVAYGWKMRKFTERRKGRCRRRRRGLREDAALHPQSSVRLHKYWVHGQVAGSQVNMTYEYCRSHSLPSCPPQLLMSGSELAQLLLEALLSTTPETSEKHRQMDKQTKNNRNREPARQGDTCTKGRDVWPSIQGAERGEVNVSILC